MAQRYLPLCLVLLFVLSCKNSDPPSPAPAPIYLIDNKTGGDLLGGYKRISVANDLYALPDTFQVFYSLQGRFIMQGESLELYCTYDAQGRYLVTSADNSYEGLPFKRFTLFDNRPDGMLFTLYGLTQRRNASPIADTIKGSYRKIY